MTRVRGLSCSTSEAVAALGQGSWLGEQKCGANLDLSGVDIWEHTIWSGLARFQGPTDVRTLTHECRAKVGLQERIPKITPAERVARCGTQHAIGRLLASRQRCEYVRQMGLTKMLGCRRRRFARRGCEMPFTATLRGLDGSLSGLRCLTPPVGRLAYRVSGGKGEPGDE